MPSETHRKTSAALHFPSLQLLCTSCCFVVLFFLVHHPISVSGVNIPECPLASPNIVATKEEAHLKVLVPNITSLRQFVNCSDPTNVSGFCIDVFERALSILSPSPRFYANMSIHYTCFNFSSAPGATGPTYDDMVDLVADGTYDAVVGDVTIAAHRLAIVDFTPKYMESGIVILTKVVSSGVSPWLLFGSPFSLRLWCTIVGAFAFTSCLICYLEKENHPQLTEGRYVQRLSYFLGFSLETLVLLDRESLKNTTARGIVLAWLFFVLLLNASYTAGLSSFLTATNLSPSTPDILSLRDSGQKIGYRRGSVIKDYLTQRFHLPEKNLVPMRMVPEFLNNLTEGLVAAIVDELPYVNIMLSILSSSTCDYGIAGQELTQEGFGFGFSKTSNLERAFSIALLNLTETGCLQKLQDLAGISSPNKCSGTNSSSNQVTWKSSFLLFIILLGLLTLCIIVNYGKIYLFSRSSRRDMHMLQQDVELQRHPSNGL